MGYGQSGNGFGVPSVISGQKDGPFEQVQGTVHRSGRHWVLAGEVGKGGGDSTSSRHLEKVRKGPWGPPRRTSCTRPISGQSAGG